MVEIKFETKTDINGNTLKLYVDLENKTFEYGYFLFPDREATKINKSDLLFIKFQLLNAGWREV